MDATPITRGVTGPGDERAGDERAGDERAGEGRAGEERNGSAIGRGPTVDKLFISLDYTIVMQYKDKVGKNERKG